MKKIEFPETEYAQFISSRCASCGDRLKPGWARYMIKGNYCDACNVRAGDKHKKEERHKLIERLKHLNAKQI